MRIKSLLVTFFVCTMLAVFISSCATNRNLVKKYMDRDAFVTIETTYGNIKVRLYDDTPKHKENFLKLVENETYVGTLFHRVIKNFMIQAGDPTSKTASKDKMLGEGDLGYTVDAEFMLPKYFHKKGALCAARQGDDVNPAKSSSACQFYIVTGKVFSKEELKALEKRINDMIEESEYRKVASKYAKELYMARKSGDEFAVFEVQEKILKEVRNNTRNNEKFTFTPEQIEIYTTIGGSPHLDGGYTVFGEVIEGMEVVDKIQQTKTGRADRPEEDIRITKVKVSKK